MVGYHLQHRRWLDDAMRVRDLFCASRPPEVKAHCGGQCVVALKMHVNNYIGDAHEAPWLGLGLTLTLTLTLTLSLTLALTLTSVRWRRCPHPHPRPNPNP